MIGCRDAELTRAVFMLGHRSQPEASKVKEGMELSLSAGAHLAVFGAGDLGEQPWGKIELVWNDADPVTFTQGGIISWAPEGVSEFHAEGVADVPLVAYLVDVKVDESRNPSSMTVKRAWQIQEGAFTIKKNQLGQRDGGGPPATRNESK